MPSLTLLQRTEGCSGGGRDRHRDGGGVRNSVSTLYLCGEIVEKQYCFVSESRDVFHQEHR